MELELKVKILEAVIEEFNEKGLKFTMDDLAARLSMSKKTIYTVFSDKESLLMEMVNYCFQSIKESEKQILENDSLDTITKLKKILIVLPDRYQSIDYRKLTVIKEKYPNVYSQVQFRLHTGWEPTIALLNQAMDEGLIQRISIPILKAMIEATIEQFFIYDVLSDCKMSYPEALEEMISIIMNGITIKQ